MQNSIFLADLHHAYAQTDGTYAFPNSREGDMLKTAKREIEALELDRDKLRELVKRLTDYSPPRAKDAAMAIGYLRATASANTQVSRTAGN